jgi:curved DNA-binding protein
MVKYALHKIAGIEFPEKGKDLEDTIMITPGQAQNGVEVEYSYRKRGQSRNLMLKVPPGIRSGQRIRLRGMGALGKAGGEPGNLYLKVRIRIPLSQRLKNLFK